MAVTTDKTNKPILPRGADVRPIDSYNRAALYSGKALDFDGVNDYVNLDGFAMSGSTASFSFYVNPDGTGNVYFLDANPNRFVLRFSNNNVALFSGSLVEFDAIKTNEWTHLVYVLNGTSAKCYANGVQLGTEQTITAIDLSAATDFDLGRWYLGGAFYDGGMSNVRIFNTALTAAQVADLYNNPEKIVPTGVANTALKLWLPMQEGAGTTAFNGSPDALGSEVVTNGDFSDGTNNWTATFAVISAANNQITVDDSTNLGGDSRATQAITTEAGKKYRLVFTKVSTTSFFFIGIGAGSSYNNIFYSNVGTSTGVHTIEFTATSTVTTLSLITGGTGITVFANVSIKEQSGFGTISGATWSHGIGAPVAQTAVINWNKVSDGTNDVLLPQGLTTGRDITGVNLFENARKYGALNLDGNSWAEVHDNASLDITDAITLEAWYYNDGVNATKIIQGRWSNQVDMSYLMYLNNSNLIFVGHTGSATFGGNASTTSLASNQYSHVAMTYDRSYLKYYINGSLVDTFTFTVSLNPNATVALDIGRNDATSGVNNGSNYNDTPIAQPRIYNRALTASEVLNNYNVTKDLYI